jgi:hypothetical protein
MAEKRTFGMKSVKMGDVGAGAMTLLGDGNTLEGTASFTKAEDDEKPFYSEEHDDPIEVIKKKGISTLEFAIVDFTPATLVRVLGGEVNGTTGEWDAPESAPEIEQEFEVITKKDVKLTLKRAKVNGSIEWPLSREDLGRVKIKATVLAPTDGSKPYSIGEVTGE